MTEQEVRKAVASLLNASPFLDEEESARAIRKAVSEYLWDSDTIPSDIAHTVEPFMFWEKHTVESVIRNETSVRLVQLNSELGALRQEMIYLRTKDGQYEELLIPFGSKRSFITLIKTEIKDKEKYQLFKLWFFDSVVHKEEDVFEDGRYYVAEGWWRKISTMLPHMVEKLKEEGLRYYEKTGYFVTKAEIEKIKAAEKERLDSLTPDEKKKLVEVRYMGRMFKVV